MSNGRHIQAKDRDGKKQYLGDGVYAVHDGYGLWLTAEDGEQATDAIYLEPGVLDSLNAWIKHLIEEAKAAAGEQGG